MGSRHFFVALSVPFLFFAGSATAIAEPVWCQKGAGLSAGSISETERTICEEKSLWGLDGALNTAYVRARYDSPGDKGEILSLQRQWLVARDRCGPDKECIRKSYKYQLGRLEAFFQN